MSREELITRHPEMELILNEARRYRDVHRKAEGYAYVKWLIEGYAPWEYETAIKLICAEMEM